MAGSLAAATSTRVDSASKHILPCKVNTDYLASMFSDSVDNAMRVLQTDKMKYCTHKDDIVIGTGRPMYGCSINNSRKKAYPSVISTMGAIPVENLRFMAFSNFYVQKMEDSANVKQIFGQLLGRKRKMRDYEDEDELLSKHWTPKQFEAFKTQRKENDEVNEGILQKVKKDMEGKLNVDRTK